MCVWANVYVVGDSEHEIGHNLLRLAAIWVCDRCESRRRVERTARTDEDVAPKVYGGLILSGRLLIALLCWRLGLWWTDEITSDHDILLDHAFPGQNDMART